jgi:hypothetical protein
MRCAVPKLAPRSGGHCYELAAGRSIDDVIADYPQLERADVLGALEYAAAATRDREIPLTAAG